MNADLCQEFLANLCGRYSPTILKRSASSGTSLKKSLQINVVYIVLTLDQWSVKKGMFLLVR